MYQISAETPWNRIACQWKHTYFKFHCDPKGETLWLIPILSSFLKPVWLLCFPSRKEENSMCHLQASRLLAIPGHCYSILKRGSSLVWRKTHFLPKFILTREKNVFAPWQLGPQTSLALWRPFAALHLSFLLRWVPPGTPWLRLSQSCPALHTPGVNVWRKIKLCKCFPSEWMWSSILKDG